MAARLGLPGTIERAQWDALCHNPSEGITIRAGGQSIRIRRTNQKGEVRPNSRLFEGLVRKRVMWVGETRPGRTLPFGNDRPIAVQLIQ